MAILAFFHLLIFVYWLGGDLGAFYASTIVTDREKSSAVRAAAARMLANIDLAPRSALILALPSGMSLAVATGWMAVGDLTLAALWMLSLIWLALIWHMHLHRCRPTIGLQRADTVIRWFVVAGLLTLAVAAVAGAIKMPAFIVAKCAILALCILCGLAIRVVLKPFGAGIVELSTEGDPSHANAAIARALSRARPLVVTIWLLIATAAYLGVAHAV